jgi:hypothetical protein
VTALLLETVFLLLLGFGFGLVIAWAVWGRTSVDDG